MVDVTVLTDFCCPVTRDALRALQDEVLRDRSSAERHAEVAYRYANALGDLMHVVRRMSHLEDFRALSERLLAVEQANASLHATLERLAPLEVEVVELRAQNQLLVQLLGGRGHVEFAPAPTLPRPLAPNPVRLEQARVKHRVGAHPFRKVQRIPLDPLGHDFKRSDKPWTNLRPEDSRGCMCRQVLKTS
ncbi:uncharacterized protein PHALS_03880 [Plasmopara halstedii]|uniref:Uncharacterized protein n=1 Tax=Plasmopara halstedii TaxID=4781 RepID=A0A0P1B1K4_PLAHL|nr:uncharacterized protein PHALS_03880 [Plasmopara halstedii]CEG47233.1 hypothetical protein PHALS_03880 [Plasmopara halstedii]|eukprot:XP_024583602.1 hypothetical protein PHALS_03880 [Plasmopara halstedii]